MAELHQQAHSVLGEGSDMAYLGELYMRQGRLDDAERHLLVALKLNRQADSVYDERINMVTLGDIYLHYGRLHEAESHLLKAVELCRRTHAWMSLRYAEGLLEEVRRRRVSVEDTTVT